MTQAAVLGTKAGLFQVSKQDRAYTVWFWLLLAGFELLVFSMPLFPTGDSGLHLYYVNILRDLLLHREPLYAHFYAVRHLVQPYLLHYYAMIGLMAFLSPNMAEKVLVGLVMAILAVSFRFLVRTLSLRSPGLTLWIFPFLLSWPLAMGALNYVLALGFLFFAFGTYLCYLRAGANRNQLLLLFVGWLVLLVLAHPVPLLLLIGLVATELLFCWWSERSWSALRPRFFVLGLACSAFLIPVLIADKSTVGRSASDIRFHATYLREMGSSKRLKMFFFSGWIGRVYNRCYFLLLPVSLIAIFSCGFLRRARMRALTEADQLAVFSAVFLTVTFVTPSDINGSSYFALRLWLPCWLLGLAALSGTLQSSLANRALAFAGAGLALVSLIAGFVFLRPIAAHSAKIERAPLPTGKLGLLVQSQEGAEESFLHVGHALYFWNAGRAFAEHRDVLLNSAWLQLTILPVRENGRSGLLRDYTLDAASENPNTLQDYFVTYPETKARALHAADFIFFVDPRPDHPDSVGLARKVLGGYAVDWQCNAGGYYTICTKAPQS